MNTRGQPFRKRFFLVDLGCSSIPTMAATCPHSQITLGWNVWIALCGVRLQMTAVLQGWSVLWDRKSCTQSNSHHSSDALWGRCFFRQTNLILCMSISYIYIHIIIIYIYRYTLYTYIYLDYLHHITIFLGLIPMYVGALGWASRLCILRSVLSLQEANGFRSFLVKWCVAIVKHLMKQTITNGMALQHVSIFGDILGYSRNECQGAFQLE